MEILMSTSERRVMTHAELLALPVSFDLETANRALGYGRTHGYALAKSGRYPVRLLEKGSRYRVTRYDLFAHLGLTAEGAVAVRAIAASH